MRLTLRIIKQSITAIEYAIDEVAGALRGSKYANDITLLRKSARQLAQQVSALLDRMIDDGGQ